MKTALVHMAAALLPALAGAAADPKPAATAVNEFGVALHQRLATGDENLCLSPYSIQTALAMTYAGADGATQAEMAKVLRYGNGEQIHESFAALRTGLESSARATTTLVQQSRKFGGPSEPIRLNVANRLYGQAGYAFKSPFKQMLGNTYRAPFEEVDFARSAPAVTKRINEWVENQTSKKIRNLIPANALNEDTRLVLVNAVYFKAAWAEEFHEGATKPAPFHVKGAAVKEVPTMGKQEHLGYAKQREYTSITVPYVGRDLHLLLIVPDAIDGLKKLEKELTADILAQLSNLPAREVILHLPKFRIEPPTIKLGEELQGMGMTAAFDKPQGSANFERMAPRKPNDYLYISEVFHKTFLALDEKGTEAAAATAVAVAAAAAAIPPPKPIEVKVDRPFFYAIQHRPTGACLFIGRVTDPR